MPNVDKTVQLKKKFKSAKIDKLIRKNIEGLKGNIFAFVSDVEYLPRNTARISEFGHIYILEELDEEQEVLLVIISLDLELIDDKGELSYVTRDNTITMLQNLKSAVNCMFIYKDGQKKEIPC